MKIAGVHWSIVIIVSVCIATMGVLAALGKTDTRAVGEIVLIVLAWITPGPTKKLAPEEPHDA